jgi:hypothetical protein
MKALIRLGFFALMLVGVGAFGQSNLPACPSGYFHNCYGYWTFANGSKYVGEWKDFKYHGMGIEYDKNGNVLTSGLYTNGEAASRLSIDTNRFPFDTSNSNLTNSQVAQPNFEIERLRAEANESKRKQAELEAQLRQAQQQTQQVLAVPPRPTLNARNDRRVALVIGNATYKNSPLRNPVNDSNDMAQSLKAVGFDVVQINNATLAQMREATRRFADKLALSDVGLVYYSGHGLEVKGKNYLVPVNADITREYEVADQAFDASQFLEMMESIRGPNAQRVNILIVDACRNNDLPRSWRSASSGLARMDAPGGTFISFATAPGKVAADGQGRNSPYTKHLLQAMKQPNVPIEQAFKLVRRNVMDETKGEQVPWDNSSLVGDFYFTVQR